MSAAIVSTLASVNLALAGSVLAVLALRGPVRRRFGALSAYLLWLTPILCALAALVTPPLDAAPLAPLVLTASQTARHAIPPALATSAAASMVVLVWLAGAIITALLFAVRQARFTRSLGRLSPHPANPALLQGQHVGSGPMLLACPWPRIVVPADFDARFQGEARELVLAHERVHLARGDAITNALAVAVQCLAWFNPLVHLGAHRLRLDQEMACDEAVLVHRPEARRLYAETLLDTLLAPRVVPFGCHWPAGGAHPLKERLAMLNIPARSPARRLAGLGLVCAVSLLGGCAVWNAKPAPVAQIVKPDWAAKPTGDDMARFYPASAAAGNVGGRATIDCRVTLEGRLTKCKVLSESPGELGFGAAALRLADVFQMRPSTRDGKSVAGGQVVIPILFAPKA